MNEKFEKAVSLLKKAVKSSHLDDQKHIDFSLVNAPHLDEYKKAMITVQTAVKEGEITQDELKKRLGLI
ncbi:MAG: hypothetical protein CME68_12235 [Halobacteriovoraceae bacterium]|nr:hypothetical protein [Halobacteriovoraceae bacterium]|tara:strand:+ start:1560 stop:1766 length:207 start_codon:yes stop_codon:yes gene_type:complete